MPETFQVNTSFQHYRLDFKFDAGTSRGVLKTRDTYFISSVTDQFPGIQGIGEAAPLPKLSLDDVPEFEAVLQSYCEKLTGHDIPLSEQGILDFVHLYIKPEFPSIRFAFEMALLDLFRGGQKLIFPSPLTEKNDPIPINGLIWMDEKDHMLKQIDEKLASGYSCVKIKIGAIDFKQECALLAYIRSRFKKEEITLRVDANGAFKPGEAMEKLLELAAYDLHSIEQPIQPGQWGAMAELCKFSPVAIALDEELIGIGDKADKVSLLESIMPPYIILKPTLLGGFRETLEWIEIAESRHIGWWITSALESNLGLNAIAQFTSGLFPKMPQGLGTGQLFHNNIASPLRISDGFLHCDSSQQWGSIK